MKYTETKTAVKIIVSLALTFILGFLVCKYTLKPVIKINFANNCLVNNVILKFPKGYNYED